MRRVAVPFAVLLAVAVPAPTQAPSPVPAAAVKPTQDELLAAELASPFLRKAPWLVDYDEALAAAKARQHLLFAYLTTVNH